MIKIDIEGGEVKALAGMTKLIASAHPVMIVSVHSQALRDETEHFLRAHGYQIETLGADPEKAESELLGIWSPVPSRQRCEAGEDKKEHS